MPTPIGNLGDISRRMTETMAEADFLAVEDTRVTVKLLNHLDLKKSMITYHRHNAAVAGQSILNRILAGESCALLTDAGTPAISDPGEDLVALCAANGVEVVSIPGPCALIAALSVSGLPTGRFTFEGFLPLNKKNRRAQLGGLAGESRTMIFYEAPHKLLTTLKDLEDAFGGGRRIAVCRELTKLHEEILRTDIAGALSHFQEKAPKGEFVLVVEGAQQIAAETDHDGALVRVLQLREEGASLKDAAAQAAAEFGLKKKALYDLALGKGENENYKK